MEHITVVQNAFLMHKIRLGGLLGWGGGNNIGEMAPALASLGEEAGNSIGDPEMNRNNLQL